MIRTLGASTGSLRTKAITAIQNRSNTAVKPISKNQKNANTLGKVLSGNAGNAGYKK